MLRMKVYILMMLAALSLSGCATHRVAEATSSVSLHEDSTVKVQERHDTLLLRDSVSVVVETRHDTVFKTEYRERVRWKVRETHDTLFVAREDSAHVARVEAQPHAVSRWRGVKEALLNLLVAGLLGVSLVSLARLVWRAWRWK